MRSRWVAVSSTTLSVLALAGCGGHRGPSIFVTPRLSAEYQPIEVRATGLKPHELTTIVLRSTDANGIPFAGAAVFHADAHGRIDLAHTAPVRDDPYSGVWQMGLLVSMSGSGADSRAVYNFGDTELGGTRTFTATIRIAGRTVASTEFRRTTDPRPLVLRRATVGSDGFQGSYAAPAHAKPHSLPAVLELGGSEGGAKGFDYPIADNGIAILFVGYFGAPGLPKHLERIPLEYFRRALLWLDRQPEVDPKRVVVLGTSRGSEAALLLGVHYPSLVHGVAAIVPSNVVNTGLPANTCVGLKCTGPAWTFRGKAIPYTTQFNNAHPTDVPAAVIPVERIRGPIFLTCGGADQLWPSCRYAHAIEARLRAKGSRYPYQLWEYPHAGHFGAQVFRYWIGQMAYDTFAPDDERARDRLWPHAIAFLKNG